MIKVRVMGPNGLQPAERGEKNSWIDVIDPSSEELALLEKWYKVKNEHLVDVLDIDEQSRIEKEDDYTLLVVRLPVFDARYELPYFTVPCGVFLFSDRIITICQTDCDALAELRSGKAKGLELRNKSAFVLHLLGRSAIVFLRYLKEINRRTAVIERELQRSVKNHELTQLLSSEKSLVFFTTSLKSNEILLEKLQATRSIRFKEDEAELIEDVVTDNKQAIEMANIYSDILSGMMDAFASVISNNLNIQMKRLTIFSVMLMVATFVVSAFSMNVDSPLPDKGWAFWAIIAIAAGASALGGALMMSTKPARPRVRVLPQKAD